MREVITALIIVPTIVLTFDIDNPRILSASLYPHIIKSGNITIIGEINKKSWYWVCFFAGIAPFDISASTSK